MSMEFIRGAVVGGVIGVGATLWAWRKWLDGFRAGVTRSIEKIEMDDEAADEYVVRHLHRYMDSR